MGVPEGFPREEVRSMKLTQLESRELRRYLAYYDFSAYLREKTCLITGGKGLCGGGIIKWLLMENSLRHTNVKILASTREPSSIPAYIEPEDNVRFIPYGGEREACEGIRVDYIIHLASPTQRAYLLSNPVEAFRTIIDATEQMLELAVLNAGCAMIYLSSEEIYGAANEDGPVGEEYVGAVDSLNIRSCYPLGKKAAEMLSYTYAAEYGVNVKIIRPTLIQGLFQSYGEGHVTSEILRCILENKNLLMKSDGSTKKCLMYSLDAISAIFTVLFKGERGQAYNASNPDTFLSVRDLAAQLLEEYAPNTSIEFSAQDRAASEGYLPKRSLMQDITKLQELGWEPKTSLRDIYRIDIQRFSGDERASVFSTVHG